MSLRELLAELLPRELAFALGVRRRTPTGDRSTWPSRTVTVEELGDTGGTFRAAWREQDPAVDPREPNGGESSSVGNDHGWSGCTCTAGALAIAYQEPRGALAPWGGDLRHRQSDLSGGTDLYDVRNAWSTYGETLTIRSGAGWSAVKTAHDEGRAIVIQGTGNVPGSESFDGGHACCIAPETHADGRWLFGDPLASGWQWVDPGSIRSWAERWQSSVAFATGERPTSSPPPTPTPPPLSSPTPSLGDKLRSAEELGGELALDDQVAGWVEWLAPPPTVAGTWDVNSWASPELASLEDLVDPCDGIAARWGRGAIPDPYASARHALDTSPRWDGPGWRSLLWG